LLFGLKKLIEDGKIKRLKLATGCQVISVGNEKNPTGLAGNWSIMALGRHAIDGDITGNINQQNGKHHEYEMPHGVGMYPVGNRNRSAIQLYFGFDVVEDREGNDPNVRWK
jgi:hypothetical protein